MSHNQSEGPHRVTGPSRPSPLYRADLPANKHNKHTQAKHELLMMIQVPNNAIRAGGSQHNKPINITKKELVVHPILNNE